MFKEATFFAKIAPKILSISRRIRRAVKFMKSVICDKRKRKLRCCAERETIDPPDLSPLPPIGNDTVKISNLHIKLGCSLK